jgi:NAD(P)-dependent dehydrogenase (short-subunit alcohol dehydrogenase family)
VKGTIMANSPVAIVVGAGAGLGHATALALHSAGLTVVAVDRSEAGLRDMPAGIHREVVDATDPDAPGPLVERVATKVGPPAVLVNTIGAYAVGDALSVTPQTLRQMMDVNLGAALWLTQAVVPHMRQQGAGVITHVAARPGLEPTAGAAAYGISKAALVHLTRILDLELRPHGIRVNAVVPQVMATAKNKSIFAPEALVGAAEPDAVAGVIAFLISNAAADISGALVPTYGG